MANERWFWQPNPEWVNTINITNLRSINGIRMGVVLVFVGILAFVWATWHGIPHCHLEDVKACPESINQVRASDFALGLFNSLCIFVGAIMGIAVAGAIGKRLTDTEFVERKEAAKAQTPRSQQPAVAVQATDQATVRVETPSAEPLERESSREEEHRWRDGPRPEDLG